MAASHRHTLRSTIERVDTGWVTTDGGTAHHDGLLDRLEAARVNRPVGLLIVGWEIPTDDDPGVAQAAGSANPGRDYARQVERSVAFGLAAVVDSGDVIVAASPTELAVILAPLTRPATTEGLAHRVAQRLDVELDRLGTEFDRPAARWAIGLVVDRPDDEATGLVEYARRALDDAWLLGARRIIAFDDDRRH